MVIEVLLRSRVGEGSFGSSQVERLAHVLRSQGGEQGAQLARVLLRPVTQGAQDKLAPAAGAQDTELVDALERFAALARERDRLVAKVAGLSGQLQALRSERKAELVLEDEPPLDMEDLALPKPVVTEPPVVEPTVVTEPVVV